MNSSSMKRYLTWVICSSLGVCLVVAALITLRTMQAAQRMLHERILAQDKQLLAQDKQLLAQVKQLREQVGMLQESAFSDKIDALISGAPSDKERVLRVAGWIATSFLNAASIADDFTSFALRTGLCRNRADVFVKAMSRLLIPAKVFNLYNFPDSGTGHSAVIVWYEGKWRYLDIMFGGYFEKNGDILSWDEVAANPEDALSHLVMFPSTLDKWLLRDGKIVYPHNVGESVLDLKPIGNDERLKMYYTAETIQNVRCSSGPLFGTGSVKTLRIRNTSGNAFPLRIGYIDNDYNDVDVYGCENRLTEYFGFSLSSHVDFFSLQWNFIEMIPKKTYNIIFYLFGEDSLSYTAKIEGGTFVAGDTYTFSPQKGEWLLRFVAEQPEITLSFFNQAASPSQGPLIDAIYLDSDP